MEAFKQDGRALKYASEDLKCDREVVVEAIKQEEEELRRNPALRFASEELRGDRWRS